MQEFIQFHVITGYVLLTLGALAAFSPRLELSPARLWLARTFFIVLWIIGLGGLIVGVYRHPTSISVFQVVTLVGLTFATIGLLTLAGKLEGFRGKSRQFWYANGLGGSLIAATSGSLFFIALQFFPDFYRANSLWFIILFIAVPVLLGQRYIARFS